MQEQATEVSDCGRFKTVRPDSGPSEIGTQHYKPLCMGHFSKSQIISFPTILNPKQMTTSL